MRPALAAIALGACGARTELAGTVADASTTSDALGCHDEIIATDAKGAGALALDGDVVFWGTEDGFVRVRDASGTKTLASEPQAIAAIAVDATYVYYATIGSIRRVPRAGGAATDLVANAGQPMSLASSGGELYWLDYGSGIAAGSAHATGLTLLAGLDTPGGLAVADGHAFVTAALALVDQQAVEGPLLRVDLDGSNRVALAQSLHEPKSVTTYGGRVYWIEQTDAHSELHGGVRSIDENGGTPAIELATDGFLPIDVAADASGIYATALSQPESVLFHGTSVIAKTPGTVYEAVRTSATAVYWTIAWTSASAPPQDGATVRKLCK